MSTRPPWDGFVPEADLAIYRKAGLGAKTGIGRRAALLVIDVQYRSMGESAKPILESMDEFATSCGEAGWAALPGISRLIDEFRRRGWPVIYPHVAPKAARSQASFTDKAPGLLGVAARGYDFVQQVAPHPGDLLIPKPHASAFFGTSLVSQLVLLAIDSVVITGCTTSGCVRSSAVDANAFNYKVVVPHDAVYDRSATSHAVSLFDIAHKYADVASSDEVITLLPPV